MLQFGQARGICRDWHCTLASRDGEYIVRAEWDETNVYYTNDLEDAVNTARAMWTEQNNLMKQMRQEREALMQNIRVCALFEAVFSNGQTERRPLA